MRGKLLRGLKLRRLLGIRVEALVAAALVRCRAPLLRSVSGVALPAASVASAVVLVPEAVGCR